ncbi:uncharacterized protein PADG_06210 [Paracoccidioides brasiliensis Pb18]|uniref:Uncharacterized protein n=1 Tax=Paracoccidioides brasiliensis (strain Pb18) TaxID=502780 RepID=C1GGZ1_PARBD|nr:uncharacterized protein PADG_06210 [Paracoccidioides brasiliensis Pb18]EEH50131.2 hypothetical protein PADG_06210 [Paracoccidioides brasiliensis Pb18]
MSPQRSTHPTAHQDHPFHYVPGGTFGYPPILPLAEREAGDGYKPGQPADISVTSVISGGPDPPKVLVPAITGSDNDGLSAFAWKL